MKSQLRFLLALFLALATSAAWSSAQTVTYTFESSQFVFGQASPFLNKSPDTGLSTFRASFTSSPGANAFRVGSLIGPNPSFSGQDLYEPAGPPISTNTLTISLNMAIKDVQLDFALFAPGHLELHSSAGNVSAFTSSEFFQAGTLTFHASSGFTQFDLLGFDTNNQRLVLAIDNLSMTLVPEPSAWAFLLGAFGLFILRRRVSESPA